MAPPILASCDEHAGQPLEYHQLPWGELIYATAAQLRRLGLGSAAAFPGEIGCSRRRLTVIDPRGLRCQIEACASRGAEIFVASIRLPGRAQPEPVSKTFAPGVRKIKTAWTDDYLGTAPALAAAGLIRPEQLPGRPGMRKVVVSLLPDGTLADGARARSAAAHAAGAKSIRRASRTSYRVSVIVDADERTRRYDDEARARWAWEERMRALPRPAALGTAGAPMRGDKARLIAACRTIGNVTYLPSAARRG